MKAEKVKINLNGFVKKHLHFFSSIYFCIPSQPRGGINCKYMKTLSPQEQWFAIIRNLPNFARKKPLWLGGRYEPLLKLAQSKGLTSLEQVQYLRAMVSEREKEDIARAYLRRGREEGREEAERKEREKHRAEILQIAKNLLEYGLSPEDVAHNTGLSLEELATLSSRA